MTAALGSPDVQRIVQISSILSMIGSVFVILSWRYPKENRTKEGRILLLWLSVSDLLTAFVYFLQTVNGGHYGNIYCKTCALLGIYFPVASFIWTDCIAYFLYFVIATRFSQHRISWRLLLRCFHVLAWSLPAVLILFVVLFDHAGRSDAQDDFAEADNTAGWCWIAANSPQERFIWELIGGKVVEWVSSLIIVPFLYATVAYRLRKMDLSASDYSPTTPTTTSTATKSIINQSNTTGGIRTIVGATAPTTAVFSPAAATSTAINPAALSTIEEASCYSGTISNPLASSSNQFGGFEDGARSERSDCSVRSSVHLQSVYADSMYEWNPADGYRPAPQQRIYNTATASSPATAASLASNSTSVVVAGTNAATAERMESGQPPSHSQQIAPFRHSKEARNNSSGGGSSRKQRFNIFNAKLFAVPLVFLFIRFWGSLRIVLELSGSTGRSSHWFLVVMQAFFDPSQGFFNALLFVFSSKNGRSQLLQALWHIALSCCCIKSAEADELRAPLITGSDSHLATETDAAAVRASAGASTGETDRYANDDGPLPRQVKVNSTSTDHLHLLGDFASEYECDSTGRLSNFSFDLLES